MADDIRTVLFLCTGNYYRSRFAEMLFNALAGAADLPWQADSRGLALERGILNVGPMSSAAIQALQARGVRVPEDLRFPAQAAREDLTRAGLVIALKEAELAGVLQPGQLVMVLGFGVGYSWAGAMIRWSAPPG